MNDGLRSARRGAVLELTLDRPQRRNALSQTLIARLTEALRAAATDAGVRVVLLTGMPPAFCAGLDLHEVADTASEAGAHDTSALLGLYEAIECGSKPVVAAVNGPAVAGGAILAGVCDLVVCGRAAEFGFPGIRHGLVAPITMPYLLRLVGERRTRYLLLTGAMIPPPQAVEWGLANECVDDTELLPRARWYADLLATQPPDSLAQTRTLLNRLRDLHGPDVAAEVRRLSAAMPLTPEARAGVARFLEPRRWLDGPGTL